MIEFDNTVVIITARMTGQGLPGAPMLDVGGKPLVVQATEMVAKAGLGHILVAARDNAVAERLRNTGGDVLVVPPTVTGDALMAEYILALRDSQNRFRHVLVFSCVFAGVESLSLRRCLSGLMNTGVDAVTLATPDPSASSATRVLAPLDGEREVAWARGFVNAEKATEGVAHIPITAWARDSLARFAAFPEARHNGGVSGEELGLAIAAGLRVAVVKVDLSPLCVDTAKNLEELRRRVKEGG